jgi:hypothetical protein
MKNALLLSVFLSSWVCSSGYAAQKTTNNTSNSYLVSEKTTYTIVDSIKDLSYASIRRIEVLIAIPKGRSKTEVTETLKRAATEIARREKPNALVVEAFSEGDQYKHGSFTAGEAIWAPNGKWEDAGKKAEYKVTVNLGKLYFEAINKNIPNKGDTVKLASRSGRNIAISSKRDSWEDEDIIKKVPSGTTAFIIERYEEALSPEYVFVRYKIKVGNFIGWVGKDDIAF